MGERGLELDVHFHDTSSRGAPLPTSLPTSRLEIADDMIKLDKQEQEDPRARRGGGMGGMPGM